MQMMKKSIRKPQLEEREMENLIKLIKTMQARNFD